MFPLVSGNKDNWFPLEMIVLDDLHAYEECDHVMTALKLKGADFETKPTAQKKELGNEFFRHVTEA
jgi:hypothetical protein